MERLRCGLRCWRCFMIDLHPSLQLWKRLNLIGPSTKAVKQRRGSSDGAATVENRGDGRGIRGDGRLLISDALLDERRRHERQAALDKQHAASECRYGVAGQTHVGAFGTRCLAPNSRRRVRTSRRLHETAAGACEAAAGASEVQRKCNATVRQSQETASPLNGNAPSE